MDAAFLSVLRCTGCGAGGLVAHETALECPACGRAFPVRAGIPVMIGDALPERGPLLDTAVAACVMGRLDIPPDPIGMLRVRRASGARVRLREGALREDGRVLDGMPGAPPAPAPPAPAEGRLRCEWLRDYVPRAMEPGVALLANIQFRNAGPAVMPSGGAARVEVAHRWDDGGEDDLRTKLLADVAPGQIVTVGLRLQTPAQAGVHALTVNLVQEGGSPLGPGYGPFRVQIRDGAGFVPPPHWVVDGPGAPDGAADRARAAALMREWVRRPGLQQPRVLELGGGAVSQAAQAGYEAFNVDGDLLALQLGRLAPGPAAHALCARMASLPLAESAFDAIVCFGAVHAMVDPAQTLRTLRAHLRPGGFIGVFCEPVGPASLAPSPVDVLAAWRRGLNPQLFSVAEYAFIFRKAGLRATELAVAGASMTARLEPEDADA